jgi:toxin-antitoxin system PIN domain toxin
MPDVNILVYAHREDDPLHDPYRLWLEDHLSGPQPFALSVLVAVGFVRIVTNPRIFDEPTPSSVALAAIDTLAARSGCRWIIPGPRHWQLASGLCRATGAHGSLVADAQHTAVAIEHGCEWVTRDRDFEAFADHGLDWSHLVLSR